ncbi:protein C15orf41 homolog [Trichonephila clavipes]|nr:protein C15orf41 homolog [Trichonephila clavipes]
MLLGATKDICNATIKDAVKEAVLENQNIRDIPVAVDGTWQRRGYSSMNGVVTVTSVDTGKKNFDGYSERMEVDGALSIFQWSVQRYDVRYTKYIGDGDSKAFDNIIKNKGYGDNCTITKLECMDYVMKWRGSRLQRFITKMRCQKLSDGKALCGKNRLTEATIDQLQTYGLAIQRNLSSVKDVRQVIWAIFVHKISTDKNPQHGFCPSGPDTWCHYKKAQLENKVYHHKHKLLVAVVEAMRPIFRDLSDPELMKKCLHGSTQNPNESINNVILSCVPKKTLVHIKTLSFGTYDAIASFNKGNATKLDILKKLNIEPGYYATCCMERLNKERITRARYANLQKAKEIRKCTLTDCCYGPICDVLRNFSGLETENKLKNDLTELGISFIDEKQLREKGYDKTPDVKLNVPIVFDGHIINWIESKASFGDVERHREYLRDQYWSYCNRFGPGLVIYWNGYIDELNNYKEQGIVISDSVPTEASFMDPSVLMKKTYINKSIDFNNF